MFSVFSDLCFQFLVIYVCALELSPTFHDQQPEHRCKFSTGLMNTAWILVLYIVAELAPPPRPAVRLVLDRRGPVKFAAT